MLGCFRCVRLCNPVDLAHQAPLSMGFSRQDTGVACRVLLQGIFLTWGSNPRLLHCRQILYCWATREAPFLNLVNVISHLRPVLQKIVEKKMGGMVKGRRNYNVKRLFFWIVFFLCLWKLHQVFWLWNHGISEVEELLQRLFIPFSPVLKFSLLSWPACWI